MFIVCADRNNVVNVDNVASIGIDGNRITAVTTVDDVILGRYAGERVKEVYADLLKEVFPPSKLVFKNCDIDQEVYEELKNMENGVISVRGDNADVKMFDCGVFYMPEE